MFQPLFIRFPGLAWFMLTLPEIIPAWLAARMGPNPFEEFRLVRSLYDCQCGHVLLTRYYRVYAKALTVFSQSVLQKSTNLVRSEPYLTTSWKASCPTIKKHTNAC